MDKSLMESSRVVLGNGVRIGLFDGLSRAHESR